MSPADELGRGERLRAYVDAVEGKPVVWGQDDCSTWPLQWVLNETQQEIEWRAYDSREEADAIIAAAGGLLQVWDQMARDLGLTEWDGLYGFPIVPPPIGSVGIIETQYHGRIGVIFASALVACARLDTPADSERAPGARMIGLKPFTVVKVWTL